MPARVFTWLLAYLPACCVLALQKNAGYFTSSAGKLFHDGMDDPISWSYPSNQTRWISCHPGDIKDTNGNYCGITNASTVQYTDEDLVLDEGLKRIRLAHASGKPWY